MERAIDVLAARCNDDVAARILEHWAADVVQARARAFLRHRARLRWEQTVQELLDDRGW